MKNQDEEAIKNFFEGRLALTRDLHNVNDMNRLYNVALAAAREEYGIPNYEMEEAYKKALKDEKLDNSIFDAYFQNYMKVLSHAFHMLSLLIEHGQISNDFKF